MKRKTATGFETLVNRVDGFVFSEPPMPLPYTIEVADGWRVENRGGEIAYIPSIAPVGMDIYPFGGFSPENESTFEDLKAHFAAMFTRLMSPETTAADMENKKVDGADALYFQKLMEGKGRSTTTWRQWIFCKQGQCFAIVSAIDQEKEAALWPDVQKMIDSFKVVAP